MSLKLFQRMVTEGDDLIEIEPGVVKYLVPGIPGVHVHVLPDASVVPVTTTCRQYRLIGTESLKVIHTTASALKTLSLFRTTYIII